MGGKDGAGLVVSVGAGFDGIQAYTEKTVYLRASYSF
jgi:NADPH:quinone reductase-like Zn-dependent oxidoreductase